MKKLLLTIGCVLFILITANAFADAKLRIKIAGAGQQNNYFLCVGHAGCLSIKAGNAGQVYQIDQGEISRIYASNLKNMRVYIQPLPDSCNVAVKDQETITVTGTLASKANHDMYINNLRCQIKTV